MARMHSGKHGKSGSTKPTVSHYKTWLKIEPENVEKLVIKFAKEGLQPSQIGTHLRDVYGVPDVKLVTGKKILKIMKDQKLAKEIPYEMLNLMKQAVNLRRHLEKSKKDLHSTRGLTLIESKIKRLQKYYKNEGILPADWRYNPETAKLLVQ